MVLLKIMSQIIISFKVSKNTPKRIYSNYLRHPTNQQTRNKIIKTVVKNSHFSPPLPLVNMKSHFL